VAWGRVVVVDDFTPMQDSSTNINDSHITMQQKQLNDYYLHGKQQL